MVPSIWVGVSKLSVVIRKVKLDRFERSRSTMVRCFWLGCDGIFCGQRYVEICIIGPVHVQAQIIDMANSAVCEELTERISASR